MRATDVIRTGRRGLATGSVLLVALMLLTLGVAGSLLLMGHFRYFDRSDRALVAQSLAESAIARMMSGLSENPQLGQNGQPRPTHTVTSQAQSGARGFCSFDPAFDGPVSINNLGQPPRLGYQNRLIPRDAIQLVGLGRCGEVERVVVATLAAPPFRDALTTCGPFQAKGGVTVAGLQAFPSPGAAVNDQELRPASLLCNAGGAQAVFLGADTHVRGSVRSVGTVVQEPGALVDEGVRQVEPYSPQRLTLTDYDPAAKGLGTNITTPSIPGGPLSGAIRTQGSLAVNGDLKLRNALIYVDGDLVVEGSVQGDGLIVCTGKVTFKGAAQLDSGTGVALLAGGDIKLTGSGASGSSFKGLVYTDGGFEASQVTMMGPLVSRGTEPVVLDQARVLMPQNLPANVTWQGGSQAGPDPAVYHTDYTAGGASGAGANWDAAFVYEKHERTPGDPATAFYRRFTFRKTGGVVDPTPLNVAEKTTPSDDPWSLAGTTLSAVESVRVTPDLGNPPPPPPADPQKPGPPGWTVGPSQFYNLARRVRVVLWQTS